MKTDNRFEISGMKCGVQSCDAVEANVFISVDAICIYARLYLGEFEFNLRTPDSAKKIFTMHKEAFLAKIAELSAK